MDRAHVLELLDTHRRATAIPGYGREDAGETCRFVDADGARSRVLRPPLRVAGVRPRPAGRPARAALGGRLYVRRAAGRDGPRSRVAASGAHVACRVGH